MANSHVPKFGNWENDDIPYTAYFDDARKDKPVGNVRINPNDPEENPEAFMTMMQRRESSRSLEGYNASHEHNLYAPVLQAAAAVGQPPHRLMKSTSTAEKSCHTDDHTRHRERRAHHKNTTTSTNHKSPTSESGGDQRTSPDYSLLSPPNQGRYVRSDDHYKKKSATTSSGSRGSDSSSSASEQAGHRRHRRITSSNSSDHQHHHRAASIPKFGSWDVNDPKTGEGFTIIFDKIKEEKQSNAAAKVPAMSPPRRPSINNHKDQRDQPGIISSCISKICCCSMSSSGSK